MIFIEGIKVKYIVSILYLTIFLTENGLLYKVYTRDEIIFYKSQVSNWTIDEISAFHTESNIIEYD